MAARTGFTLNRCFDGQSLKIHVLLRLATVELIPKICIHYASTFCIVCKSAFTICKSADPGQNLSAMRTGF